MLKTARYWRKWQKSVIINKKEKLQIHTKHWARNEMCFISSLTHYPVRSSFKSLFRCETSCVWCGRGAGDVLVSAAGASLFILVLVPWHYTIDCASWGVAWAKYEMIGAAPGLRQPLVKQCRPDAGANGHWQVCRHESDALCWCWHLQQDMFTIHEDVNRPWDSPLIVSRAIHCDLKVQYRLT